MIEIKTSGNIKEELKRLLNQLEETSNAKNRYLIELKRAKEEIKALEQRK